MAIVLAICGVARLSIGEEEIRLSALGVFIVLLSALGYALYITTVNKFLAGGSTSRLKMGGRAFHGEYCIRMNLALPYARVQEAFERLDKYVFNAQD